MSRLKAIAFNLDTLPLAACDYDDLDILCFLSYYIICTLIYTKYIILVHQCQASLKTEKLINQRIKSTQMKMEPTILFPIDRLIE